MSDESQRLAGMPRKFQRLVVEHYVPGSSMNPPQERGEWWSNPNKDCFSFDFTGKALAVARSNDWLNRGYDTRILLVTEEAKVWSFERAADSVRRGHSGTSD